MIVYQRPARKRCATPIETVPEVEAGFHATDDFLARGWQCGEPAAGLGQNHDPADA